MRQLEGKGERRTVPCNGPGGVTIVGLGGTVGGQGSFRGVIRFVGREVQALSA